MTLKTNKMKINTRYIAAFVMSLLLMSACTKDFEEINTKSTGITEASDGALFNKVIESFITTGNEYMYLNNEIIYPQTQLFALTSAAWGNFTLATESMWSRYYKTLPNLRELKIRFDKTTPSPELTNMRAMCKIALAYKTFPLTDMFGDIPFSQAGQGFHNLDYIHPAYDKQEDIYKYLLDELKWCDENIDVNAVTQDPFKTFATFDPLFHGDMLQWQKLANSLRLRYAMRMSEKEPELAGEIILDIRENDRPVFVGKNLQGYVGEAAVMKPAQMGFTNGGFNWAVREHKHLRVGTNVWAQVATGDNMEDIFDARAYIFFERNNNDEWVEYPQIADNSTPAAGGVAYGTHRDNAGAFSVKGETCIYSGINYFLHRDWNNVPIPIITGAEVHFIYAEAYLRGIGLPQDPGLADNEYMNGIGASLEWWKQMISSSNLPTSGIRFVDYNFISSADSAYYADLREFDILNVFGSWMAESDEEKLEFLYTQRWLDLMLQPQEAYALARRTGATPREGSEHIEHFRMPYPPSEQEFNSQNWQVAKNRQGGDDTFNKIWWIPDSY